jgi:superfamily II DNA or RNA helicase
MMSVRVSNKIFVKNFSMELIEYCQKHLVLDNPEYHIAEKMGRWTGNIQKYLHLYEVNGSELYLPFGVLDDVWVKYINEKSEETILDFASPQALTMVGDIKLYPYQELAVDALKSAKNGVLQAPCGSGKTQMGIALIKSLGQKALWITHTKDLLNQSLLRAKEYFNGDFGVITDGKVHIGSDITFATVQTLSKLDLTQYSKEWNVVIVDECHRSIYGLWRGVIEYFDAHVVGLTATPTKQTLGFFQQNLVSEYTFPQSVADKVNVDFEVYRIKTKISESGSTIEAGTVVPVLHKKTREQRLLQLDNEMPYSATDLDRSVVSKSQIRTVLETFRDRLFTEIFPGQIGRASCRERV